MEMLQGVDRSKNRTVRKSLGRDRIPKWALFGVQPIGRFETKSMFVANKSVKALKAIVDLRKAMGANKKFAMTVSFEPPNMPYLVSEYHYSLYQDILDQLPVQPVLSLPSFLKQKKKKTG